MSKEENLETEVAENTEDANNNNEETEPASLIVEEEKVDAAIKEEKIETDNDVVVDAGPVSEETAEEKKLEDDDVGGGGGGETEIEESELGVAEEIAAIEEAEVIEEKITPDVDAEEVVQQHEPHPFDDLTDQQVIDLVQEIELENRHLNLENILFESFLRENDPTLLESLEEIMQFLVGDHGENSAAESTETTRRSSIVESKKYKLDSYMSITTIAEGKGPKINLSQKTDMVMRAMEESQSSLEGFIKKCHIAKRNLKSELQEFQIRETEIKEATDIFEFSVVTQGVDKLTQRIPAEKFIRYMEEWLKSAQLQIEKLRLRIATLKVQYKKVSQQLIQRQELGENVHAVDFDQLEIENKHFIQKIDQKNIHLIELKKMNGGANLILSTHKKFLQKQQEYCNKLKMEIEEKNKQIGATENECEQAEDELQNEEEKFENCRNLKSQYRVPEVMEYVTLKSKLHEIKKNIKIWIRRRKIQDIALNTCLREMKNLTGASDVDPSWFEEAEDDSKEESSSVSEELLL